MSLGFANGIKWLEIPLQPDGVKLCFDLYFRVIK